MIDVQVETRFVQNAEGILVPVTGMAAPPPLRSAAAAGGDRPVMRKVYLCPTCKIRNNVSKANNLP